MSSYERTLGDLAGIRACAEEHGFCLIRDFFTAAEIVQLKAGLKAAHQQFNGDIPDLMSCSSLRWILFDARTVNLARALLGDDLVYYPEGSVNHEDSIGPLTLAPYTELHCDAFGMPNNLKKQWSSPTDAIFRGYRFGIYLQDYSAYSGGLKLCPNTHRGSARAHLENDALDDVSETIIVGDTTIVGKRSRLTYYNVPSRPGDLVVWNLRTIHAAGSRLVRGAAPEHGLHPRFEDVVEANRPDLLCPIPGPRLTMFFDYAAPTEDIDLYIKGRTAALDEGKFLLWVKSLYDQSNLIAQAHRLGIRFRFDHLIASLVAGLKADAIPDSATAVTRLLALTDAHSEYSPFHPLFDRRQYQAARAAGPQEALRIVFEGVSKHSGIGAVPVTHDT